MFDVKSVLTDHVLVTQRVQLVHVALWSFRQTGTLSPAVSKAVLIDMKRTLISIGGGPNEFALRQQAPNSSSKSWRAFAIVRSPCSCPVYIAHRNIS